MAMNLFTSTSSSSSASAKPTFPLFSPSQTPNNRISTTKFRTVLYSYNKQLSSPVLDRQPVIYSENSVRLERDESLEAVLEVRRPVMEVSGEEESESESESLVIIDAGLEKFAKKMPIFEPERVEGKAASSQVKPLMVNLDLALYKAKVLGRSYSYEEAQEILKKCISCWPEDGRAYVALGKLLGKQSKTAEARAVYEKGCQATQGENPYIWQCWAVLENRMGNIRRARELFDAATVADKRHIAAWHGWAVLELKQGNVKKARQLLAKGLKFCGGNEYVYQTLALLEAKANRYEQARYLFKQATKCNPNSCASWLAWAQLETQQENYMAARQLFQKAIQASPKNRFAWHIWGVFEASVGNVELARKLLKIGHALNPKDPVLLQSLALLEYKYSTAGRARVLFRSASQLDLKHQPVWFAWGWMEWKEGNLSDARKLYQKVLSLDPNSESAARCLQAWGVLEQRVGNTSAARRLFRSSLNINSQSYVTWMTWAQLEEDQGNSVRADEIRNLYFQQRTEVVDDASWVMGFLDIIDPAVDSIRRLLKFGQKSEKELEESLRNTSRFGGSNTDEKLVDPCDDGNMADAESSFDLDSFVRERLSLDPTKLDIQLQTSKTSNVRSSTRRIWRPDRRKAKI